jgi:hypothetical protein
MLNPSKNLTAPIVGLIALFFFQKYSGTSLNFLFSPTFLWAYVGMYLGDVFGRALNIYYFQRPDPFAQELSIGFTVFGMVSLMPIGSAITASERGETVSPTMFFLFLILACAMGILFFYAERFKNRRRNPRL